MFPSRIVEPQHLAPYENLLNSKRVKRVYLNEHPTSPDAPPGLGILQLVSAPEDKVKDLTRRLVHKAKDDLPDRELGRKVIELVEGLLIRRYPRLTRKEVRAMFQLESLRNTRAWQEVHQEGVDEGMEKGMEKGETKAAT